MHMALLPYPYRDQIPHGKLQIEELEMTTYADARRRTIRVWLPEEYDGKRRFPVVYMHDGQGVFRNEESGAKLDADRALTSLAGEGISAIVVAVDTAHTRMSELTPAANRKAPGATSQGQPVPFFSDPSTIDQYADFIVYHLKPLIDQSLKTLPDPKNTCIGGISAGGTASYYMFLRNPEVFGRAIVYSPSFPIFTLEGMLGELDAYDFSKLDGHRIAFYNGDQGLDVTSVDHVLAVYRKMKEKGMDATQLMFLLDSRQTHYEAAWAKYLPETFRFLFAEDNRQPTR